jgi:signal transduction histidine kinase
MLEFNDDIRKALIAIAGDTQVHLEGSILKLIDPGDDPEFRAYFDEAVRRDKAMRQRRLDITKQVQHQNKELTRFNDQNAVLNAELRNALEEQRKAQDKLLLALEKQERQNQDLAQFSWMISHNLRGPLASALGIINLMKDFKLVTPDNRDLYNHLRTSALRMDEILTDVSMILEIRDDPPILNEDINVDELFTTCCDKVKNLIDQHGASVSCDFSCCTTIYATKVYVESIVTQLLSNAIQYRAADRSPQVTVFSGSENGFCTFSVRDNGKGIRHSDLSKVFEPFRKLDYSSTGKGLGLYLSRSQAEAMGGTLTVTSEIGHGSVFTLRLPSKGTMNEG